MSEWKEYRLGDIVTILGGFAYKGEHIGHGEGLLLGMGCVSFKEKFLMSGARPYAGDCAERYYANPGDLVLATRQQSDNLPILGMPAIIPQELDGKKLIVGANLYRVSNHSDFSNKYLYWLLKSNAYVNHIASCKTGTTVSMITKSNVEDFVFKAPEKQERARIVSVLSSLDDKIDLLHRENATLEAFAETLFHHYFIENPNPEWKEGNIADVVDFNPARKLGKGENAPYVEMANVGTNDYAPSTWRIRPFQSGTKFINGDALMARISPCLENGKAAFVDFLEREQVGWGSTEFIVMRSKLGIHPFFVYVLSKYDDFRDHAVSSLVGSSGRQRVDLDNLIKYPFIIPDKQAIELFNHELNTIFPKIQNNQKQIHTLTAQRDTLLSRLMNGEVNVVE